MRTTVTLDADIESAVRRLMAERGVSFEQALNDAIRAGAATGRAQPFSTRVRNLGARAVDLDRALGVAGDLEDEELLRACALVIEAGRVRLVEANVLLHAVNADAPHHETSRRWLDRGPGGEDTRASRGCPSSPSCG